MEGDVVQLPPFKQACHKCGPRTGEWGHVEAGSVICWEYVRPMAGMNPQQCLALQFELYRRIGSSGEPSTIFPFEQGQKDA